MPHAPSESQRNLGSIVVIEDLFLAGALPYQTYQSHHRGFASTPLITRGGCQDAEPSSYLQQSFAIALPCCLLRDNPLVTINAQSHRIIACSV